MENINENQPSGDSVIEMPLHTVSLQFRSLKRRFEKPINQKEMALETSVGIEGVFDNNYCLRGIWT